MTDRESDDPHKSGEDESDRPDSLFETQNSDDNEDTDIATESSSPEAPPLFDEARTESGGGEPPADRPSPSGNGTHTEEEERKRKREKEGKRKEKRVEEEPIRRAAVEVQHAGSQGEQDDGEWPVRQTHQPPQPSGQSAATQGDAVPRDLDQPDPHSTINPDLLGEEDDTESGFSEEIESGQEYIQITPVREQVNSDTVIRELYGLHQYGNGRKLPLDMELHIDSIDPTSNFEFIIYKPSEEAQFKFFIGPGERGDVSCDRLESTTRSQYPENFEFDREQFDITDVFEQVPHMVRFEGVEEHRKDWMTMLTRFDTETVDRSPLSNLLESIIQSDGAVLFQVIFEPRSDWSPKAQRQKGRLKRGVHTAGGMVIRTVLDAVLGVSDEERQERHRGDTPEDIGGTIMDSQADGQRAGQSRMAQIDLKNPSHTYNMTLRAAAESERCAKNLQDALNQLSGQFYSIDGNYLGKNENEYKRMLNHGLTYPHGLDMISRRKPLLVGNVEELASFITVPSIDALPKASRGGTGGKPKAQSALTSPNEEVFKEFTDGMTIGHAVTALRDDTENESGISAIDSVNEWRAEIDSRDALSLDADDLTHHYIRAATTGSGKTVATLNDMLTTHENLEGPTLLIDPKGGEMCQNYLRCHRTLFGDLDNVEYMRVPEKDGKIPGIPFFDIRPLVEGGGKERETAVQNIIDHYFQLLRFVLGRDTVDQAFVANEILTNLIKALFDEEHGHDYFTIGDLLEAAQDFQHYGRDIKDIEKADADDIAEAMPPTEDTQVANILSSHLEKEERQFMNTTDAVLNRIRKLKERDFIWDMLSYEVPDEYWDDERGWYDRTEVPMLDLNSILNSDKVVLIDTGNLRGESSEVFTVLFLSHLWTSIQSLWTPNDDDYIANVIIEESADIARNEIVYSELLPKGREFNLSLGLVMQYPEQVLGEEPRANRRSYQEILNNVNTKIIGNIATDDLLANSLFHEDLDTDEIKDRIAGLRRGEWVVQLPSTGFHKQKPEILTLKPLPIPPGHSEGPFDVSPKTKEVRERSRRLHCLSRNHELIRADAGADYRGDDGDGDGDGDADGSSDKSEDEDDEAEVDTSMLDWQHRAYLANVFQALNGDLETYSLGKSMTKLPQSEVASELEEWGFLEKVTIGQNQVYYLPTDSAEFAVDDHTLRPEEGGELGDESAEHRLGVQLATAYYEQQGYNVTRYKDINDGENKTDAFADSTKESPTDRKRLVEVETSPEKKGHVHEDYEALKEGYGDGVWIVKGHDEVKTLLKKLDEIVDDLPTGRQDNIDKINEQLDDNGVFKVHTLNSLRKKL